MIIHHMIILCQYRHRFPGIGNIFFSDFAAMILCDIETRHGFKGVISVPPSPKAANWMRVQVVVLIDCVKPTTCIEGIVKSLGMYPASCAF